MIFDHFAEGPVDFDRGRTYRQHRTFKPQGFWVSVRGEDDWEQWCREEEFAINRLSTRHEVTLTDDANVLLLSTAGEVEQFYRDWNSPNGEQHYTRLSPWDIDWPAVAQRWDGIIIAPYQWGIRLEHLWYYGWDCASGCIWNLDAVAELRVCEGVQ